MESKEEVIWIDGLDYIHCPVCGELVETYEICDNCYWENTGITNIDGGPNKITLKEAQRQFKETGKIKNFELLRNIVDRY